MRNSWILLTIFLKEYLIFMNLQVWYSKFNKKEREKIRGRRFLYSN